MLINTELSIGPLGSPAIREPNHQWSEPPGSECSMIKGVSDLKSIQVMVSGKNVVFFSAEKTLFLPEMQISENYASRP